ncbi:High affinity Ca2+/Mn2+ P-type ATPase-like protein [Vanrija albida]|uniref:Calcium-transporting ATPase n=1 Tax=Vanrija albida TaxID=181172 RepID=A0ABR3QAX9_9TREE
MDNNLFRPKTPNGTYRRHTPTPKDGSPDGEMASASSNAYARSGRDARRPPVDDYAAADGTDSDGGVPTPSAGYMYSTTLRRERRRSRSTTRGDLANPYESPIALQGPHDGANVFELAEPDRGVLAKAIDFVRKVTGKRDYAEVAQHEAAAEARKLQATPSAVYAHKSVEETIKDFHTDATKGLESSAVPGLLSQYGPNEFELPPEESLAIKFAKQVYENPLILLLLGSSLVSALMGNYDDAFCVVIAVAIVLTVGFVQEQRSEKSLEALNKLVPHYCHLIRNGHAHSPLANTLLPGDLVTFSVGDRIPADIRIIKAVQLEIDESALTGETRPARKTTEQCIAGEGEDTHGEGGGVALSERHCIAFMGTLVRSGHGSGIVVGTGKDSEFGVVFAMMQDVEEKRTPLQLSMDELAKQLSIFSFGVIGLIVLIGVIQSRSWIEMFTIGVSLAVAAIPEGLPIVTTVTLALGVLRMSKRKAIVKKLPSVEALGSVSVVCSDKTGTLTKNEMTVTHMYTVDDLLDLNPHLESLGRLGPRHPDVAAFQPSPALKKTAQIGSICNNSFRNEQGINVGNATEVALINLLPVLSQEDERKNFVRKNEVPFSSETKTMFVTGSLDGGADMVYMKGAIESVLARCKFYYINDSSTPTLDAAMRKTITDRALEAANKSLRVIGMAYGFAKGGDEDNLIFTGFQAMLDPPRRGIAPAIKALHSAGIQVVMITGDSEPTALAIARDIGMKVTPSTADGTNTSCMLGSQIDQLSERELIERVPGVTVYARTTPRHKMAIVKAWQMRGGVVAMTGDGVNDSPALKMADIGVSMGRSGTDVAKEAADVILVDDDFSSILPAVEEGRSIFYNIQNFLSFQLSTAVAALALITLSTFFRLANPLNAMQILFINILMDGPPAQALGVDPSRREVMRQRPRRKDQGVLNRTVFVRVGFSATMIILGTLFIYARELQDGSMSRRDQTMTFTGFVFLDLVSAIQNRGITTPILRNRMLFLAVSVSFLCQLGLVYVPLLQHIFQTEALSFRDLFTLLAIAGTSFGAHEGRRWYERKQARDVVEQHGYAMA